MSNRIVPLIFVVVSVLLSYCVAAKLPTARITNFQHQNTFITKELEQFGRKSFLLFIENKGQIVDQYGTYRQDIDFKTSANGINVFIGKGQVHYQWNRNDLQQKDKTESYRLDMQLVNANPDAELITEEHHSYCEHYYLSQLPNGVTAHSFKKVVYKNIYPNIDWVLYTTGENDPHLKYDFVVHPGGNPDIIRMRYDGANSVEPKTKGYSVITPFGEISEKAPFTYELNSNATIPSSIAITGNIVKFKIGDYNKNNSVVIDPFIVLNWCTYYGGSSSEGNISTLGGLIRIPNVCSDGGGNVCMAGVTLSSNNIATSGVFQATISSNQDGFVVKLNQQGQRIWGTYYGGTGIDGFTGLGIDARGMLYAAGVTWSNGLATSGSHQTSYSGYQDGLIVKFNDSGQRIWASYFGGSDTDIIYSIAVDDSSNFAIVGTTKSTNGIATSGAFQTTPGFSFVAKLDSAGRRQWGTYYGAAATYSTVLCSVDCDTSGNIFAGGETLTSGLATSSAFKTTQDGKSDGILVKFTGSGSRTWATYYGGITSTDVNVIKAVACDNNGNVFIAGDHAGTNTGLYTTGAYLTTGTIIGPSFLAKFGSSGTRTWGTLLPSGITIQEIALDASNDIYITGSAASFQLSYTFSATPGAYQTTFGGGGNDGFLMKINNTGTALLYSTYFGATFLDHLSSVTWNNNTRRIFVAGTSAGNGLATTGAHQTSNNGSFDAIIASFATDTTLFIPQPFLDSVFCAGDSVHISYDVSSNLRSGNVFTLQLSNSSGSFATPVNLGSVTAQGAGMIHTKIPPATAGGNYKMRMVSTLPALVSLDTVDVRIKPTPQNVTASANNPVCLGDSIKFSSGSSTIGVSYSWSGPLAYASPLQNPAIANADSSMAGLYIDTVSLNGCVVLDTVIIVVNPLPGIPTAGSNSPVCVNATINLTASATSGAIYLWTGPNGFTASMQNPIRTNLTMADAGWYKIKAILNGCIATDSANVSIKALTATPLVGSNSPICVGGVLNLTASAITGASYSWTGPGFASNQQNPTKANIQTIHAGAYTAIANANGCASAPASTVVTAVQGPSVSAYASPGSNVCAGNSVAVVAVPNNVSGPTYQWYLNSNAISGATNVSYIASTVATGDVYYVMMTAGTACNTPISSNSVMMTVLPTTPPPSATIVANPGTDVWPYLNVSFSISNLTNGGTAPTYQWKLNGVNVTGATQNKWSTTELKDGDSVCLLVISSDQCATPKSALSNCLKMKVPTSVSPLQGDLGVKLAVYPNPCDGNFYLVLTSPYAPFKEGSFTVTDVTGRVVASYTITETRTLIQLPVSISSGVYVGKYIDANGVVNVLRIVVE